MSWEEPRGEGAKGRRYCPGGEGSRSESPWAPALEVLMFPLSMTELEGGRGGGAIPYSE